MDWLREHVWQLGIAIVLALVGTVLIYAGTVGDGGVELTPVGALGLISFVLGMAIPLVAKAARAAQDTLDLDV